MASNIHKLIQDDDKKLEIKIFPMIILRFYIFRGLVMGTFKDHQNSVCKYSYFTTSTRHTVIQVLFTLMLGLDKTWGEYGGGSAYIQHPGSDTDKLFFSVKLFLHMNGKNSMTLIFCETVK